MRFGASCFAKKAAESGGWNIGRAALWGCSVTVAQISPKDLDWVQLLAPLPKKIATLAVFCYAGSMMKRVKKIVAIGGGSLKAKTTFSIDKEIIKLSGLKHPKILFIPTASSDAENYWFIFKKYFKKLGCKTDVLYLISNKHSQTEIRNEILSADIVYVGGGNTLKMMRIWKRLGVDIILKKAYKQGIVMSGLSAGSICWFESGHSDSMSFYHPKKWKYINVRGLGLIKGVHCPHYNSHTKGLSRRSKFSSMIDKIGGIGIAIDENCAIEFVGDKFRVISSKPKASAYLVYKKKGDVIERRINKTGLFRPLNELYLK